jgi:hypothetical protein
MQLAYTINQAVARVGQLADASMVKDVQSFKAATVPMFYGRVASRGASTDAVIHPTTEAGVENPLLVRGIVIASHEIESQTGSAEPSYPAESVVPVLRKGRVWVLSENAVTEGTSVPFVRHAVDGGNTAIGKVRAGTATGATGELPTAKFLSSTTGANQLVLLQIDL